MDVSIVGSGYVGTTVAACLADLGHDVTTVDIDDEIVATINAGEAPIREAGLDELLAEHAGGQLPDRVPNRSDPGGLVWRAQGRRYG